MHLKETLLAIDPALHTLFAVVDGAQFGNLPKILFDGGFVARSLYLDRGDNHPERVVTAPHLVWLDRAEGGKMGPVLDRLQTLLDRPAAMVFWHCPSGGEALFRHLRGINMVLLPNEAMPEDADAPEAEVPDDTHSFVLFRHADANVIAQVAPSLTEIELVRLMGPARHLICAPDPEWADESGLVFMRRPEAVAPAGPLRLSPQVVDGIDRIQRRAEHARLTAFLSDAAPEYTQTMPPQELLGIVSQSIASGDRMGLQSEHSKGLWAMLALITGGETLRNPELAHRISVETDDPDQAMVDFYDEVTAMMADGEDA